MASFVKKDGTIIPMVEERSRGVHGIITSISHNRNFLTAEDEVDIVIRVTVPAIEMLSTHYHLGLITGKPVKIIQ